MKQHPLTSRQKFVGPEEPEHTYGHQLIVAEVTGPMIESEEFMENPVYRNALSFLLVSHGEMSVSVDFIPYRMKRGSGLVIHKHHTYEQLYPSADFRGTLIITDLNLLFSFLQDEDIPSVNEMLSLPYHVVYQYQEEKMYVVWDVIDRLRYNLKRTDHRFQKSLIRNEFNNLLAELWEIGSSGMTVNEPAPCNAYHNELAARFTGLLILHCRRQHEINFYAHELCVTPVFLSRAMKKISGQPAGQWIANALMANAKVLLRKPGSTIQDVSVELNFADQSSFGKFFKKHAGISPLEYKLNHKRQEQEER